jgi:hypothetical protein
LGSSILESFRPLQRHHGRLFLAVAQGGPLQDSESRVAGRGSRGQPSVQNTRRVSVRRCNGARRVEVSRFPGCCNVVLFVCRARPGTSQQLKLVASVVSGDARSRIQARREVGKGSMRGMLKDTQSASLRLRCGLASPGGLGSTLQALTKMDGVRSPSLACLGRHHCNLTNLERTCARLGHNVDVDCSRHLRFRHISFSSLRLHSPNILPIKGYVSSQKGP